jgi:hypothetical protein
MAGKEDRGVPFGIRVACAYVPSVVTANIAAHWLAKPLAWGLSSFLWLLVAYWLPPESGMRFWRWLLIVTSLSFLVWLAVRFQPDMF